MTVIRALVAAAVSLLFPGAGHAVIRDWVRALLFAGVYVSAVALVLPVDDLAAANSLSAAIEIVDGMSLPTRFLFSFLFLFAAADAGFRAMGVTPGSAESEGPTCPNCGRELDADLEFCHWCTTRLEFPERTDAESQPDGDVASETDPKVK